MGGITSECTLPQIANLNFNAPCAGKVVGNRQRTEPQLLHTVGYLYHRATRTILTPLRCVGSILITKLQGPREARITKKYQF